MTWPQTTAESIAAPGKGSIVSGPFGSNISARFFVDEGVPVIRGNNLTTGVERFKDCDFAFLTETKAQEFRNCEAVSDDLVFTAAGTIGQVGIIPKQSRYPRYIVSNKQLRLRCDQSKVDPLFLYYWFSSPLMTQYIINRNSGSSVPLINLTILRRLPVTNAPVSTQHRIAAILSAYDDLIENNRRRIQLLEQAARLIYREWFVRLRFPDHERVRVVDGVPEGWEKVTMVDVCQAIGGGTPDTKNPAYWEGGEITWVIPSDITQNNCLILLDSQRKITEAGLQNSSAKLLPPETILMTSRASVGFFGLIDREVCTNQGFIAVVPNSENLRMYLLYNLLSRRDEILLNAKGTTYLEINKATFRRMGVTIPDEKLLEEFHEQVSPLIKQVRLLKRQVEKLKQARDLLLPKLMSGEMAV